MFLRLQPAASKNFMPAPLEARDKHPFLHPSDQNTLSSDINFAQTGSGNFRQIKPRPPKD